MGLNHAGKGEAPAAMVAEMEAKEITPILNVSGLPASFEWFTKQPWSETLNAVARRLGG